MFFFHIIVSIMFLARALANINTRQGWMRRIRNNRDKLVREETRQGETTRGTPETRQ